MGNPRPKVSLQVGFVAALGLGNIHIVQTLSVWERCNARETPGVLAALAQTSQHLRDALASVVLPLEAKLTSLQYRRFKSPVPSGTAFAVYYTPGSDEHGPRF